MTEPLETPPDKRKRRPLRILAGLLAGVLAAGAVLAGWYFVRVNTALEAIPRINFETVAPTPEPTATRPPGTLRPTATPASGSPGVAGGTATPGGSTATGTATPGASAAGAAPGGRNELPAPAKPAAASSPEPGRPAVVPATAGVNFLLLGTDFADGGVSRSDSFMVLHVSADRSKVYVISYPRDSYVDIPGYGKGKINWAYQWGGVALAKKTIEQLSGVGIDHTLQVDFDGFIKLTDVVGGVTVNNPTAFTNVEYFPAGNVDLSGEKALHYVRARYGLPRWDLSRAANQRAVVKAIIVKTLRPEVVGNPVTFDRLLTASAQCMAVDQGLTTQVVRDLALSMKIKSQNDIVLMQAPISGFDSLSDGDSIDVVDRPKMNELSAAIKADTIADYVAKYGTRGYNF